MLRRGEYVAGRRSGAWIENHPGGAPRSKGEYRDGQKDGRWVYYDPAGTPAYEESWERGSLIRARELTKR